MKRLLVCILLLAGLTACAGQSGPGTWRCGKSDETGKLCIKLTVAEPITPGQPFSVMITVSSEKDIPGLEISLASDSSGGKISIEEEPGLPNPKEGGVRWTADVQANRPLTFTRKIRLSPMEGEYDLIDLHAFAHVLSIGMVVQDSLTIYLTREGGKVYYSETPIPITPGPLPVYTVTPGPSPTPLSSPTPFPIPTFPPPARSPTPYPQPYPFFPTSTLLPSP
jgi:hypothetical protein